MPSSKSHERKFMLCTGETVRVEQLVNFPRSHIIGELHYLPEDGIDVTSLAVYEQSRSISDVPAIMPAIRISVIGDARRIKCTCCDYKSKWYITKPGTFLLMRRLIRQFPGHSVQ